MESVILVIHLILALGIIALVLLQRSEGGGLGIGGSGGAGGLMTGRAAANTMTKTTAIFAGLFFLTSLVLGILAGTHSQGRSLIDSLDNVPVEGQVMEVEEVDAQPPTEGIPAVPISE